MTDGSGASSTATVTITVTGENEAPVANNITANAQENGPAIQVAASYTDVDVGDSHSFSIDKTGTKGKVIDNGNGTFSYDPNGAFTSLKAGATATDTFHYTVTDGSGASSTAKVTVTITGQNEAPVVTSPAQAATITADNKGHQNGSESTSGSITFTDVDAGDVHTASFTAQGSGYVGELTLDTSKHDTGGGGAIGWKFTVPDSALQHLAAGQTLVQKYTVTIDDGNGGKATQIVTITLAGEKQDQPPPFAFPCDVKFDPPPKYPEFNLHGFDGLPLGHYDSLPYMTFVAFSGWLAHDGSNVNTKSIDSIQDDDGAYCPLPQPFTPFILPHNSSHFTPEDMQRQLHSWILPVSAN